MNWAYLVVALWMVGLLVVALMHDHDLRKGLKELEVQNYELRGKMLNLLEYMIEMDKNDREMLENVHGMAKIFKDIGSLNYGEILNLRDDIRDYSKAVETQMESVGEAQLKVVEAVENLEKNFESVPSSDEVTVNESNAIKSYIDWHRENPGKTHYLDREETFERSHRK